MRVLNNAEAKNVTGAGVLYYGEYLPGFEIVGWEKTLIGYDESSYTLYDVWKDTVVITREPIYDFTPIYEPRMVDIVYL